MQYRFIIAAPDQPERVLLLEGRNAWALSELVSAGDMGCTPINNPDPRWSAYVYKLRHDYVLTIETIHEPHGGNFPGTHARYVLITPVRIVAVTRERVDA